MPDEPPEALPGQTVYVSPRLFQTGQDGTATLPDVEARSLLLTVEHADFLDARVPVGPEQGDVTVALRSGAWLEGEVLVGERRLESGSVLVKTPQGKVVAFSSIQEGTYSAGPLEAGRYLVEASAYEGEPPPAFLPQPVEVPASGTVWLELQAQW